jgi:hypothetical protein
MQREESLKQRCSSSIHPSFASTCKGSDEKVCGTGKQRYILAKDTGSTGREVGIEKGLCVSIGTNRWKLKE